MSNGQNNTVSKRDNVNKIKGGFVMQAGILALAGIIVRIIGLLYKSPLNSIIGDLGAGYYSTAYNMYTIILLISSYSIPSAIAKVISQKLALSQYKNAHRLFMGALIYVVVIGGLASILTYVFAPILAKGQAATVLKVFVPTIFFSGLLGVFRGYFQARKNMVPTSISQILEQIANAVVSLLAAYLFMEFLAKPDETSQAVFGAMGSALGTGIGVVIGLVFMLGIYLNNRKGFKEDIINDTTKEIDSYRTVFKTILCIVTPFLLSTFIYNCSTVINMTIYQNVMMNVKGLSETVTITLYGIFAYKAVTVANIPIALSSAMSSAMIPSVASSFIKGETDKTKKQVDKALNVTMLISIPASLGLLVLAKPVMKLLFNQPESLDMASWLLMAISMTVIFYSLSTVTNAVLQGIGKVNIPVIHAAVSLVLQVIVLVVLLMFTDLNLFALAIAMNVYSLSMCVLNQIAVRKHLGYRLPIKKAILKPLLASGLMALVAAGVYYGVHYLVKSNVIALAVAVILAVVVYFVLVIKCKVITENELQNFPKGNLIKKVAKKLHLL